MIENIRYKNQKETIPTEETAPTEQTTPTESKSIQKTQINLSETPLALNSETKQIGGLGEIDDIKSNIDNKIINHLK